MDRASFIKLAFSDNFRSRMLLNKSGIISVIEEESPPPPPKLDDKGKREAI